MYVYLLMVHYVQRYPRPSIPQTTCNCMHVHFVFKSSVFAVFLKHLVHIHEHDERAQIYVGTMTVAQSYGVCTACAWKQYDYFVEANFRALSSFHTCHMFMHIWTLIGLTV